MSVSRAWGGVRGVASAPFRVLRFLAGRPFVAWGVFYGWLGVDMVLAIYEKWSAWEWWWRYAFDASDDSWLLFAGTSMAWIYGVCLLLFLSPFSWRVCAWHGAFLVGAVYLVPLHSVLSMIVFFNLSGAI